MTTFTSERVFARVHAEQLVWEVKIVAFQVSLTHWQSDEYGSTIHTIGKQTNKQTRTLQRLLLYMGV